MRITSVHKDMVQKISSEYKDTFEQYNDDVNYLITASAKKLSDAYRKQLDASRNLEAMQEQLRQSNSAVDAAKASLTKLTSDKDGQMRSEAERLRKEYIENAKVYDEEQLKEIERQLNEQRRSYENYVPNKSIKDFIDENKRIYDSNGDSKRYDALYIIVDNIGTSYGETVRTDGKFTHKFSQIYRNCQNMAANEQFLEDSGRTDLTPEELMDEYAQSYNNSARSLKQKMIDIVLFPKAVASRLTKKNYTMREYVRNLKTAIVEKDFKSKQGLAFIAPMILWLVLVVFILCSGEVESIVLIALILGLITSAVIRYSDKIVIDYVRKTILRFMYYKRIFDSIKKEAQEQYNKYIAEKKNIIKGNIGKLETTLARCRQENEVAMANAAKSFNPKDIDFSELEANYNKAIENRKKQIADLEDKRSQINLKVEDCRNREKDAISDYNNEYSEVLDFFEKGIEVPTTNGFSNKEIGVESRIFVYHFAYMNIYSMLNNFYINNPFGTIINGSDLSDLKFDGGFNDLPPKNVPVKMSMFDVKNALLKKNLKEKVVNDIIKIIMKAAMDLESGIKQRNPQYESTFVTADNLDKFDLKNICKVNNVRHDNRCTLILYNSNNDKEYVKVISKFIYERLFKATYMTTNPRSARYHFVVQDRTYFDTGNIVLLSRKGGESMEVIRDMEANQIYDIIEESEFSNLLKQLRAKRMPEFIDACADMSRNFDYQINTNVEYLIGTKSRGSVPQCLDYLYIWLEPNKLKNTDLTTILKSTGGSKSDGEKNVVDNPYGVIPFIIMDMAELDKEKPDKGVLESMREIANVISYNNFFIIEDNATKLLKTDRNELINKLSEKINEGRF